jgi:hypothetical protein
MKIFKNLWNKIAFIPAPLVSFGIIPLIFIWGFVGVIYTVIFLVSITGWNSIICGGFLITIILAEFLGLFYLIISIINKNDKF